MVRIKGGVTTRKRKKKIFRKAKGYRLGKKNLWKHVREQYQKGLQYAYRDRKRKKRDFRSQWIRCINAQTRLSGISYSHFINGLKKANIKVNRKILANLALNDKNTFSEFITIAMDANKK